MREDQCNTSYRNDSTIPCGHRNNEHAMTGPRSCLVPGCYCEGYSPVGITQENRYQFDVPTWAIVAVVALVAVLILIAAVL